MDDRRTAHRAGALVLLSAAALGCAAGLAATRGRRGNRAVPQPALPVDLQRYLGLWFEAGRYENRFERGCEAATANYSMRADGTIDVVNECRRGGTRGRTRRARGRARVVPGSGNAKLKVSFGGPFYLGDYWVLDHDDGYSWSIVGEPSGRYLWLLHRVAEPTAEQRQMLLERAADMGYDTRLIRWTRHTD